MAFDPIKLSKETEQLVSLGNKRKYYRFRYTKFYGGIATADCVGCNLRCSYCWSQNNVWYPDKTEKCYSPEEVANNLNRLMIENKTNKCRISGGEPTLCRSHLLKVIEKLPKDCLFVLETNGILLGYDPTYVKELSKFSNVHVRISLKASDFDMFEEITGAKKDYLSNQISAIKNLDASGMSYNIAVMFDLYSEKKYYDLLDKLERVVKGITSKVENENLIIFGYLKNRVEKRSLLKYLKESGRLQ